MVALGMNRFRSQIWTVLLLAAGAALLVGAVIHAHHHVGGAPPPPSQRFAVNDLNRIASWMTLRYVSRAYGVPEPSLQQALQISPTQARRQTLSDIASVKGVDTRTVLTQLRVAIHQYRLAHPVRPTPAAPPAP